MENMAKGQGNDHQRDGAKGRLVVPEGMMQTWLWIELELVYLGFETEMGPTVGKGSWVEAQNFFQGSIYKVMAYFDRLG